VSETREEPTIPLTPPIRDDDRRRAMAELVLEIATAAAGELDLDRILQAALEAVGAFGALGDIVG
jgi:hypothetical protein